MTREDSCLSELPEQFQQLKNFPQQHVWVCMTFHLCYSVIKIITRLKQTHIRHVV